MPVLAVSVICLGFSAFSGFLHEADNRTLHPMRKVLRTKCRKAAVSFQLLAVSQTQNLCWKPGEDEWKRLSALRGLPRRPLWFKIFAASHKPSASVMTDD